MREKYCHIYRFLKVLDLKKIAGVIEIAIKCPVENVKSSCDGPDILTNIPSCTKHGISTYTFL
jgi:hypothetical protein